MDTGTNVTVLEVRKNTPVNRILVQLKKLKQRHLAYAKIVVKN
jgi:hypothetical protein